MLRVDPSPDGLCLAGVVDLSTREALVRGLAGLPCSDGDVHLHLDDVTFVDAGGVKAFIDLAVRLGPGRTVLLHAPPEGLRRLLQSMFAVPANLSVVS